MLESFFLQLLTMSFTASIVILFVLIARLPLKKAPKIYSYVLWGVVLFRLACPFSFESALSLLPTKANTISQDIAYMVQPKINTEISTINNLVNTSLPSATPYASVNPLQKWIFFGSLVWSIGIALLLLHSVINLLRLHKHLQSAMYCKDNIYSSNRIETAFVLGVFRPRIYLPASLPEKDRNYILLHEQTHIRRFDHIIKIISFLILCVHWFNPLVWLAFFLSGQDMEMSCDEAVIKRFGNDVKKEYSTSLLALATGKRIIGGTPLAFGEGDTKGRIKNVLNYKKPLLWVIVAATVVVVVVGAGFLTNPVKSRGTVDLSDIEEMNIGAEMPWLMYADKDIAIMQGTFGLLVYSMDEHKVIDRISYNRYRNLGIPDSLYTLVSSKGDKVYLGSFDQSTGVSEGFTHVYDVKSGRISEFSGQQPKNVNEREHFGKVMENYEKYLAKYPDFSTKLISQHKVDLEDSFLYLRADTDWSMKSLELVHRSNVDGTGQSYRVFGRDGEKPISITLAAAMYCQSLTEDELKQTEEIARNYFAYEAPYYKGVNSIQVAPDDYDLYQNQGIEANYQPGNIIIYQVLTVKDKEDGNPERSISIARKTIASSWEIINQGY
jgi:beta-lactamase regulating signal transducer with metallopeptidase domain